MHTEFDKAPKVSVVMTTLQSEHFVQEAIASILDQSWSNFELIIADGGSQDATGHIVKGIKDKRIRFLRFDGLRRSAQLNAAISAAKGELIAIMDSDDIAVSRRLAEQAAFLNSHPEISIVGTWATLISETAEPIGQFRRPLHHKEIVRHLLAMNGICFGTTMFRRGVYESLGLFTVSLTIAEDIDWFLRGIDLYRFAIDLGGLHAPQTQTVELDAAAAALGLTKGGTYPLDLFHAERHSTASHFRIETTLSFTDCGTIVPSEPE